MALLNSITHHNFLLLTCQPKFAIIVVKTLMIWVALHLCKAKVNAGAMVQETTAPEAAVQQAPPNVPTASPMSPTQGLVMSGPTSSRTLAGSTSKPFASSSRLAGAQAGSEPVAARQDLSLHSQAVPEIRSDPSSLPCCSMLYNISRTLALAAHTRFCQ